MSEAKYKIGDVLSHSVFGGHVVVIAVLGDKEYVVRTSDLRTPTVYEWELSPVRYLTEEKRNGGGKEN